MLEEFRKIERFRVTFADVDMLRHVNNLAYMRWAETLRSEYFSEILGAEIGGRRGMILANATIAYQRPLGYRERVAIGCRIARIGTKSFDFAHEVWSVDADVRAARIETTLVAIDYESGQTIPVPPEWRSRNRSLRRHAGDGVMERTVAPLISSGIAGPLGVLHLPRLWLKILLHALGRLPEGYRHGEGGFDGLVCERLGLDPVELVGFIERERPDYLQLEAWVTQHARDLSSLTVAALNARIATASMGAENAAKARARFAIADDDFANAIALNHLDDWALAHATLVAAGRAPVDSKQTESSTVPRAGA